MEQPEPLSFRAGVLAQLRPSDDTLRRALLSGDEVAFERFAAARYAALLRIGRCSPEPDEAAALVQQALGDFYAELSRPPAGSSLDGQLFRCLIARVRGRARALGAGDPFLSEGPREPSVSGDRFRGGDHRWSGGWITPPRALADEPLVPATLAELQRVLAAALDALPPRLRVVATLRDVQGLESAEVCQLLEISDAELRDALHRARSKLRAAFEAHLERASQREVRT